MGVEAVEKRGTPLSAGWLERRGAGLGFGRLALECPPLPSQTLARCLRARRLGASTG